MAIVRVKSDRRDLLEVIRVGLRTNHRLLVRDLVRNEPGLIKGVNLFVRHWDRVLVDDWNSLIIWGGLNLIMWHGSQLIVLHLIIGCLVIRNRGWLVVMNLLRLTVGHGSRMILRQMRNLFVLKLL